MFAGGGMGRVIEDLLVAARERAAAMVRREAALAALDRVVTELQGHGALVEVSEEAGLKITLQVLLPLDFAVPGAPVPRLAGYDPAPSAAVQAPVPPLAGYDPARPAVVTAPVPKPVTPAGVKVTGPFSDEEKARIETLSVRNWLNPAEIARDLNRTVQSVALYLNGQKYSKKKVQDRSQAKAAPSAAAQVQPPRLWTKADDDWLVDAMARNRITRDRAYAAMLVHAGKVLGRSPGTISNRTSSVLKDRILRREGELRKGMASAELHEVPAPSAPVVPGPEPVKPVEIVPPPPPPAAAIEAVVPPAPPFDPVLPAWQRECEDRLDRLGNPAPFTPQVDLALLEGLAKGHKLNWISADLGIDFVDLKRRFALLVPEPGIVAQTRALEMLRLRAAPKAG